jgi:hypothetical protein
MSHEDQMIAEARVRDERAAKALGDDTPLEEALHTADERALLWHDSINFLERVCDSGPEHLATPARTLLARVHAL